MSDNVKKLMVLGGRGSGKTQAMINGWKPGTTIVAASEQQAKEIRGRLSKSFPNEILANAVVGIQSLKLEGRHEPMLVDHYVYELELERQGRELMEQIRENIELKKKLSNR